MTTSKTKFLCNNIFTHKNQTINCLKNWVYMIANKNKKRIQLIQILFLFIVGVNAQQPFPDHLPCSDLLEQKVEILNCDSFKVTLTLLLKNTVGPQEMTFATPVTFLDSLGNPILPNTWPTFNAINNSPIYFSAEYSMSQPFYILEYLTRSNDCRNDGIIIFGYTPVSSICSVIKTDVSCNGFQDGTATAIPEGVSGPFTFLWSNSETTQNITGLAPGTYTVTVTDVDTCSTTCDIVITEPTPTTCTQVDSFDLGESIIINTSGSLDETNPNFTKTYLLVNDAGQVVASNSTGNFSNDVVSNACYRVYPLVYSTLDPPSPIPASGSNLNTLGSFSLGCYNDDLCSMFHCFCTTNEVVTSACNYTSGTFIKNPPVFCDQMICAAFDTLYFACDATLVIRIDTFIDPFDPSDTLFVYINGTHITELSEPTLGPPGCDDNNGLTQITSHAVGDILEAGTITPATWRYISNAGDTTLCVYQIVAESCGVTQGM